MLSRRVDPPLPVIAARSRSAIYAELNERGFDGRSLFLKCRRAYADPALTSIFRGHTVTDATSFSIVGDAERLAKLHVALPSVVAAPVALVEGGRVGYLIKHIDGLPFSEYYARVAEVMDGKGALSGLQAGNFMLRTAMEFLELTEEFIRAVRHLHAKGLSHGDAKLDNAIVTRERRIILMDPMAPSSPDHLSHYRQNAVRRDRESIERIKAEIESVLRYIDRIS